MISVILLKLLMEEKSISENISVEELGNANGGSVERAIRERSIREIKDREPRQRILRRR
jgi:hypothetical protein